MYHLNNDGLRHNKTIELIMLIFTLFQSTQRFQTSLEKKAKPCLKKSKPGKKSQIVK